MDIDAKRIAATIEMSLDVCESAMALMAESEQAISHARVRVWTKSCLADTEERIRNENDTPSGVA